MTDCVRLTLASLAGALAFCPALPAVGQTLDELNLQRFGAPERSSPADESNDDQMGPGEEDAYAGPDELTALSRRSDNPFPDIVESADRSPIDVTVRALNKVTAKYEDITIPMEGAGRFGTLEIVARHCDKRPPEEFPETTAFLQIFDRGYDTDALRLAKKPELGEPHDSVDRLGKIANAETTDGPVASTVVASSVSDEIVHSDANPAASLYGDGIRAEGKEVFSGWMFASSPALNALEHPVYDVWVIDCQTETLSDE